jgi:hypothetical protein
MERVWSDIGCGLGWVNIGGSTNAAGFGVPRGQRSAIVPPELQAKRGAVAMTQLRLNYKRPRRWSYSSFARSPAPAPPRVPPRPRPRPRPADPSPQTPTSLHLNPRHLVSWSPGLLVS